MGAAAIFDTPVGPLFASVSGGRLTQLSFHNGKANTEVSIHRHFAPDAKALHAVEVQIKEYFARQRTQFDLPLLMRGPEFHQRVWAALCEIPYGRTISYGQLAQRLGTPGSARAVGTANGANPIAIVVPCHRVIGADGSLVGYGGGLDRKRFLLDLESSRISLEL